MSDVNKTSDETFDTHFVGGFFVTNFTNVTERHGNDNDSSDAYKNVTASSSSYMNVGCISRILPSVVAMSILFVLSAVGNVTVFSTLVSSRLRKTRISTIILHLTISDLIVTFLVIPSEVSFSSPLLLLFIANISTKCHMSFFCF